MIHGFSLLLSSRDRNTNTLYMLHGKLIYNCAVYIRIQLDLTQWRVQKGTNVTYWIVIGVLWDNSKEVL